MLCSGELHQVCFDGHQVTFPNHDEDFEPTVLAELAMHVLCGEKKVFEHEGCKRVAARVNGGPTKFCNRDAPERQFWADWRGACLAKKRAVR